MSGRKIFVNLPVSDLERSVRFFTKLGFGFNPQFTDDNATCMIVSDDAFVMLLVHDFFQGFIPGKGIAGADDVEVLVALSAASRAEVDEMVAAAEAAGGSEYREAQDHGWMYGRAFQDPDGHVWEVTYMDESRMPDEMKARAVDGGA